MRNETCEKLLFINQDMDDCLHGKGVHMSDKDFRTCKKCGRKYAVEIFGDCCAGGKEKEGVVCPWCGHRDGEMTTSGFVRVEKIDETWGVRR